MYFIQRYTKEGLEHIQPVICSHCLQITAIWTFLHTCPNVSLSVTNRKISSRNQFDPSHLTVVGGVGKLVSFLDWLQSSEPGQQKPKLAICRHMYIVQVVAGVCASSKYQYMMYKYHLGFLTYLVSAISPSKCHRLREQPKPGIYGQRPLLRPLSISTLHFISCQSSFRG